MIYRYRGLVTVFSMLLAAAGGFFIYDSVTNSARSIDLSITIGASCCSLALILLFKLITNLRDPCAPDDPEQPESNPQRHF